MENAGISLGDFIHEMNVNQVEYRDLYQDFLFVRSLNTELANKYQELLDTFPNSKELDALIIAVGNDGIRYSDDDNRHKEYKDKRLFKLKKFRSAIIALESQDELAQPQKYDELDPELVY